MSLLSECNGVKQSSSDGDYFVTRRASFLPMTLLLFIVTNLFAQTEKGKYLVGGAADMSMSFTGKNNNFNMSLSPQFGVFVVKGFAIGARYTFGISAAKTFSTAKNEYVSTTTFTSGIGPLFRGYIGKKQLKGLLAAGASYLTSTTLRKNNVSGTNGYTATGLIGAAYFFNPHVSLEFGFYVTNTGYQKQLPTTRGGISVGFSVFLDKKKDEKALMNESQ